LERIKSYHCANEKEDDGKQGKERKTRARTDKEKKGKKASRQEQGQGTRARTDLVEFQIFGKSFFKQSQS
jgi:hypothetical protein